MVPPDLEEAIAAIINRRWPEIINPHPLIQEILKAVEPYMVARLGRLGMLAEIDLRRKRNESK